MTHYLGEQIVDLEGKSLFWSSRYNKYLSLNSFCSEHYFCETCLRQNNEIVKGYCRYDSLVLCEFHNNEFKPIVKQLRDIFVNNPNVKVISDLGL